MNVNEIIVTIRDRAGGEINPDTTLPDEQLVLEIERLKRLNATYVSDNHKTQDKLKAEIERLKAENTFLKTFLQSHSLKMDGGVGG